GLENALDRSRVNRLAREGAVEIDNVQIRKTLPLERLSLRGGIVVEHGCLRHVALAQAHALAVLQVDRGKQDHARAFLDAGTRARRRCSARSAKRRGSAAMARGV